ncbi:MAG TPA: SDR family oxidoreductase [Pyrinomonadaceae bacterium]|nr:SDR family oxidoreductase [Pyrinomonadaceae bacterium]
MSQSFLNKTVLIAGASQGIGKAIAEVIAGAGGRVFIGGRNSQRLSETAAKLTQQTKSTVTAVAGDYTDPAQAEALLASIGELDVLVICIGDTDCPPGFDTSDDFWDRLIQANLTGPSRLARIAARGMKNRNGGSILFIGSICGQEVLGAPIAYNAGKTGLRAVVKTMARELGPDAVRVNMISPGNIIFDEGRWDRKRAADPDQVDSLIRRTTPLGRFGKPEEIAAAAVFLCSEDASFITGANLTIDGGQTVGI